MSGPSSGGGAPIESKAALVEYIAAGCKPREAWRVGTEHEKFVYTRNGFRPVPYEGDPGVRDVLTGLCRFGWSPVFEGEHIVALEGTSHASAMIAGTMIAGAMITLEPGGQLELAGAPVETIHETCAEVSEHLHQCRELGHELGLAMIGIGFHPTWARDEVPWMPKGRYKIMRAYMPKRGRLGLDMMLRTATVQVNLDFASEADMARKMRVAMALQPVSTAIFANSPFKEGRPSGYLSYRSHVWTDTDPDRTGILPFVFDDDFSFERYVDYALDAPMYFVQRDGRYIDAAGQSFRDFMVGRLPALPGEQATMSDWADHLSTLFPEVRLKRYLEMRGADGGPWRRLCALPALWVGLLYDDGALDMAFEMVRDWTAAEVTEMRRAVPKSGLATRFRDTTVHALARQMVCIARKGLAARARLDAWAEDETKYLATLEQIVDTGVSPAEHKLAAFEGRWAGDATRAFEEYAY